MNNSALRAALTIVILTTSVSSCSHRTANDIRLVPDGGLGFDSVGSTDFADEPQRHDSSSEDKAAATEDASLSVDIGLGDRASDPTVSIDSSTDGHALDTAASARLTVVPASAALIAISHEGTDPPSPSSPTVLHIHNDSGTTTGMLRTLLEPATAQFRIVSDSCDGGRLQTGSTCDVAVSFAPPSDAVETTTVVVTDTSSGTTVAASLKGTTMNGTCLAITSSQANLGSVTPGQVGAETIFTVMNGCSGYDLGSIHTSFSGQDAGVFRISNNTCGNLTRQSSCSIGVVLAPPVGMAADIVVATLAISGSGGGLQLALLSGAVLGASDPLSPNPSAVSFGTVFVGQSVIRIVTIKNFAAVSTDSLTTTLSGAGIAQVTVADSTCGGRRLSPAESCQLKLQYLPVDASGMSGTLTVDTGSSSLSIALVGAAQDAPADASVDAISAFDGAQGSPAISFSFVARDS